MSVKPVSYRVPYCDTKAVVVNRIVAIVTPPADCPTPILEIILNPHVLSGVWSFCDEINILPTIFIDAHPSIGGPPQDPYEEGFADDHGWPISSFDTFPNFAARVSCIAHADPVAAATILREFEDLANDIASPGSKTRRVKLPLRDKYTFLLSYDNGRQTGLVSIEVSGATSENAAINAAITNSGVLAGVWRMLEIDDLPILYADQKRSCMHNNNVFNYSTLSRLLYSVEYLVKNKPETGRQLFREIMIATRSILHGKYPEVYFEPINAGVNIIQNLVIIH